MDITWGSFEYTGEEKWNSEKLAYDCVFVTNESDDQVVVSNSSSSNIPVIARMTYTINDYGTTNSISGILTNDYNNALEVKGANGYQIGVGETLTYTLGLQMPSYKGKSYVDEGKQVVGNLTITLSDY